MRPIPRPRRRVPRILLVENDPNRHDWFEVRVQARLPGARLVWCRDGGSALELVSRDPPNLYVGLMLDHDLDFPGRPYLANGQKVVQRIIARWKSVPDLPILVHSANATGGPAMRDALLGAGFTDVTRTLFHDLSDVDFTRWLTRVAEYVEQVFEPEDEEG